MGIVMNRDYDIRASSDNLTPEASDGIRIGPGELGAAGPGSSPSTGDISARLLSAKSVSPSLYTDSATSGTGTVRLGGLTSVTLGRTRPAANPRWDDSNPGNSGTGGRGLEALTRA